MSLDQAGGVIHLKLANPNSFTIALQKLDWALRMGDTRIASSSATPNLDLASDGGQGNIEIPVQIVPKDLGLAAWRILKGGSVQYVLDGSLTGRTPYGPMSLSLER
jgi:LEA14-like dessication related protein